MTTMTIDGYVTNPTYVQAQSFTGAGETMTIHTQGSKLGAGVGGGNLEVLLGRSEPANPGTGIVFLRLEDNGIDPFTGSGANPTWDIAHFKRNGGYVANMTMGGGSNGTGSNCAGSEISAYGLLNIGVENSIVQIITVQSPDNNKVAFAGCNETSGAGLLTAAVDLSYTTRFTGTHDDAAFRANKTSAAVTGISRWLDCQLDGARSFEIRQTGTIIYGEISTAGGISQTARTTDDVTHDLTFSSQAPKPGATTNKSAGGIIFNLPEPVSGGAYSNLTINPGTAANQSLTIGKFAGVAGVQINLATGTYLGISAPAILATASTQFNLNTPSFKIGNAGVYGWLFDQSTTAFSMLAFSVGTSQTIGWQDTSIANGSPTNILGQNATGAASTGGNLILSGGTGTSKAGLVSITSGEAHKQKTVTAATYTVDASGSPDYMIFTDSTSNVVAITLPVPTAGRVLHIKDKTGKVTTHAVTVTHNASETIDGANTITFTKNYDCLSLMSDGTNWSIIGEFSSTIVL